MKRSTQIGLAAAGVVLVATAWSLSGDDTPNEDLVYNSLGECREANQLSAQACEAAFADASEKRLNEAPKFQRQAECEAQYGAGSCSSATIGGVQYFLPALAGFMLARSLTGIGQRSVAPLLPPTRAACPPGSGRPECEQPRTTSSSSSGSSSGGRARYYSSTSGSNFTATSTSAASRASQSASSRGGFGSTSRSYSSSAAS